MSSDPNSASDGLLKWLSTLALPLVLLYLGHLFTSASNERTVEAKFVELAIQILREEPKKENEELRTWATHVIDKYAGVKLTKAAAESLVKNKPLPSNSQEITPKNKTLSLADERKKMREWECENQKANMSYIKWKMMCENKR